jgi:hypothetical protein
MLLQAGNPRSLLTCAATAHNVLQTLSGGDSAGSGAAGRRAVRALPLRAHRRNPRARAGTLAAGRRWRGWTGWGDAIHRQFMVSTDVATPVDVAARPWGHDQ